MPTSVLQRAFSCAEENAAAERFGRNHELVRALARQRCFLYQAFVASIPVAFGVAGTARHEPRAPAVLAAAVVVALALVASVLFARQVVRDRVQTLIAEGAEYVALRVIADERRRLLSDKERENLARSLERALHSAQHWGEILRTSRPPQGVRLLQFTSREVRDIVSLLRTGPSEARGVAVTARLITDGYGSALYRGDVVLLREELNRIQYLLTPGHTDETRIAA